MRKDAHAPTYRSWQMMKNRCSNPNAYDYAYYGGRGITFPIHWKEYDAFLADMGERPEGLTLDRKDVDKNYTKENCRWATRKEQSRNRRYNKITPQKAAEIRELYVPGIVKQIDLAARFGVCQRTISVILRGEAW